ncbi:membrane cofactor protein isoform X3 [Lathamus discolor]|uniref:membrane cofactor protein isoform X3 n=1 Tax=Lathamus discolor TaxID=678569 RepID=UPI0032B854F7
MRLSPALRLRRRPAERRRAAVVVEAAATMGLQLRPPARAPGLVLGLVLALSWLGGTRAQDTCEPPDRLQYAELEETFSTMSSFPVGSTVSYICRPGYVRIAGKSLTRTCGEDLQWSPTEKFCTERKCRHPGELGDGFVNVTDLTFGSKATFSCRAGFRLRGTSEITCVIKNEGVDWDRDLPLCERIPCKPPPSIANGHHTEAANYVYQTAVTYTCDEAPKGADPFSMIGSATIFCTYDADLNGVWSEEPPQCKVVKCENPKVENGKKTSGFGPSYTYRDSVMFECDPGYVMTGSEVITCGENNTWSPPKPTCKKSGPISSDVTPHINYGKVIDGQKPSYSVGDMITIECYTGYTLHGEARIQYIGENRWAPAVPTCQLSAYITAIICVIVAVVVFLAAFWVYKKFFAQNGSYTVDESCKETCILKAS